MQILHVMASSLKRAQPILSAASSSGFRESGIQGLRCLDDPDSFPIVAVRSSGLALESVIGYVEDEPSAGAGATNGKAPVMKSLVSESYLRMLVDLANERFDTNANRRERFRTKLLELCNFHSLASSRRRPGWEDPDLRRARKRAEGLARQKAAMEEKAAARDILPQSDPHENESEHLDFQNI